MFHNIDAILACQNRQNQDQTAENIQTYLWSTLSTLLSHS